jgi:hypothetical protein
MDPLTTAIVAAIAAGAAKVATEVVPDLYSGLKALIKSKFGEQNAVSKAIDEVEAHPESAGQKIVLQEKVKKAGADTDADIVAAAKKLLEQLETQPGGARIVQTATGNYTAQAADHSTASVNVNVPKEDRPR